MASYDKLLKLLEGKKVTIQTHNFPDPDAIGTAFGLQYLLKNFGIDSRLVYSGKIDITSTKYMVEALDINIFNVDDIDDLKEDDLVITVDGQKLNSNFKDITGNEIACIDHHTWTTEYKYEFVIHKKYGACSTIITEMINEAGIDFPIDVATALLYGITMDTFNFSRGVTSADIDAFALLHDKADNQLIRSLQNNTMEISDLKAYGVAFQNIVVYDKIGFSNINFECPDALIAMVSDFILSLSSVEVSVIYAERNGGYKFAIRSEIEEINAGRLAAEALNGVGSGGGHPTMAGGIILPNNVKLLGNDIHYSIRKRFTDAVEMLNKSYHVNKKDK